MAFKEPGTLLLGLGLFLLGLLLLVLLLRGGRARLERALEAPFRPRPPGWEWAYPLGLLLLLLAAGRPEATLPWRENRTQVVLVVDTSHSMAADDEAPSRLERAKALARAFLQGLDPTVRAGLVSFGPQAVILLPPSTERTALLEALEGLRPGGVSPLAQGLDQALKALGEAIGPERDLPEAKPPRAVLLFSDGAANAGGDPLERAPRFRQAGIPLFVRPLGDPRGTVSRIGEGLFFVPADPARLLRLAQATGGEALGEDFRPLYRHLRPSWAWRARPMELSQGLLVLAFFLLAFGGYRRVALEGRLP
ncbi:Mg-chelatase subunit ChlD [Thermus oshimai JL-2]|uniref:Mg-chelatase subunit ChlD n=1 Tax=Thermus oshimai JL-2 TaxID=751945 RepID=K7R592_THEOS|nr:VWA domain-containing protein [Thermus oshimai]AFV76119.1 Mg-chelatase subunit ChlD [Thermus oshimai JL-2]